MYKSIKIHDNNSPLMQVNNFGNKSSIKDGKFNKKYKIITKNLKNVSLNILKNRSINPTVLNLGNNYVTEFHLVKYRPKRLTKLKDQGNSQIPITEMGGNSFELEKVNKSVDKNKNFNNKTGTNLIDDFLNNKTIINNFAENEFKSYYILKFAKISEDFNKLKNFDEIMSDNMNKRIFDEYFEKISKLIETQNKLYFNNIEYNQNSFNINDNIVNNNISPNVSSFNSIIPSINFNETTKNKTRNNLVHDMPNLFSNTSNNLNLTKYNSLNNTYITTLSSFNSPNFNNFTKNMKSLFSTWAEIMINFTKFIAHILKEISIYKTDNLNLKKKNVSDETHLNKVSRELDELKKYINKFDINHKIYSQMHKENKINDLKKGFLMKENEYKLTIYKLEKEIKALTTLLDNNKIYYTKYLDLSKEIGINRKEKEMLKVKFNKELQENNIQFLVEKDLKEELNLKIEKLNDELKGINEEKNEEKRNNVEMQSLIKKLRNEMVEKKENIMMLNEELEIYIRKYYEEKSKYLTTLKDLKLLEIKVNKENESKNTIEKEKENENNGQNKNKDENGHDTPKFLKNSKSIKRIKKIDDKNKSDTENFSQNNNKI